MDFVKRGKEAVKGNIDRIIVLLCILTVLCGFAGQKEGFHLDEILSYDLANAEYNPFILPTQPVGRLAKYVKEELRGDSFSETFSNFADMLQDLIRNKGESKIMNYKADVSPYAVWISGEQFRDYLTVSGEDAFNYLSVYFNARTDIHPPLYYMLLHTVCSVFRGDASPFPGCFANMLAILASCVIMMKLGSLLERKEIIPEGFGRIAGICAALLYGLSMGGTISMLLARMYSLMGFFFVLSFYIHVKKWLGEGFAVKNGLLAAVTVAGFLTQYFFVLYCIPLACVTSALLLAGKRRRELWRYIRTMMISAALGLLLFPFALDDVFSSHFGQEVAQNLKTAVGEYGERLQVFSRLVAEDFFGRIGLAVPLVLVILCVTLAIAGRKKRGRGEKAAPELRKRKRALWLMFLIPFAGYFLLAAEACPYWEIRYMMPLFPFVAMLTALASVRIAAYFRRMPGYLALLPALLLAVINVLTYDGTLMYKGYGKQLQTAEEHAGIPCVCVCDRDGFYLNVREFMEYDRTLITDLGELEAVHDLSELEEEEMMVIRKYEMDESEMLRILDGYGWEVREILLTEGESVYGDTIYLYGRKR